MGYIQIKPSSLSWFHLSYDQAAFYWCSLSFHIRVYHRIGLFALIDYRDRLIDRKCGFVADKHKISIWVPCVWSTELLECPVIYQGHSYTIKALNSSQLRFILHLIKEFKIDFESFNSKGYFILVSILNLVSERIVNKVQGNRYKM